jgi:WD40 repeat protein
MIAPWSVDSRWVVGPGAGATFQLWDLEAKRQSYQWSLDQWNAVGCASFSPDGRYLLMGRAGRQLGIIDLSTGQAVLEIKSAVEISTCAITPDWRVLVTAGGGYLQTWLRK